MAEVTAEGSGGVLQELNHGETCVNMTPQTVSASFKEGGGKGSSRRRASVRPSFDAAEFINLFHGSDPMTVELNRLENEVKAYSRQQWRIHWKE